MRNESSNLKKKTYRGFFWVGISTFSTTLMKLVTIAILSRFLTPKEFGIVAATQIVISFAEIFSTAGVGPAIIQKKEVSDKDLATGNFLNLTLGVMLFSILYIAATPISNFVGIENPLYLNVLSSIFIINSIAIVSESMIQKEMQFKFIANINIATLAVYSVVAIILAMLDFGIWSIIYAQLIQSCIRSIALIIQRPTLSSLQISILSAKELSYFGFGFTLSRIFNNIANQADNFVVGKYLGTSALGYYSRSYQLLMLPTNILGSIMDKVTFPLMSQLQNDKKKLSYIYTNFMLIYALVSIPITMIGIICAEELVNLFLGGKWNTVIVPFQILIAGFFFRVGYKISDTTVRALGAVYKRLWIQIVYATAVFGGAIIGSGWGITGVSISTTISIMLNYLLMNYLIWKIIKFDILYLVKNLIIILSILLLLIAPLALILEHLIYVESYGYFLDNLISLSIKVFIIFVSIFFVFYLYYALNKKNEFIQFLLNQKKIKQKKKVV